MRVSSNSIRSFAQFISTIFRVPYYVPHTLPSDLYDSTIYYIKQFFLSIMYDVPLIEVIVRK